MHSKTGLLLTALFVAAATAAQAQPKEGDLVPNFTLEEVGGQSVSLQDYQGKAVMLFFFGYN
ncbi:MAG: redoxin domain-containing protein [Candidatus Latescibacteria bacterium]|nr:redoxin domain-containing protein [Candidatus Latescibacterota bacterium]